MALSSTLEQPITQLPFEQFYYSRLSGITGGAWRRSGCG
jgi:hypothetical protein